MSDQNASRVYGVRVGLVAGLFSIGQVGLSLAAAHGSEASLRAIQQAFTVLASNGIADPTVLIPALLPMLLITYLSMAGIGLMTILFAGHAGRLAALAQGRHAGGASAGMWTWLVSTGIWLLASIVGAAITHTDGTISGIFTGNFTAQFLPQQIFFLLIQEIIAALIGLGFCALAGSMGANNAHLVAPQPVAPPMAFPPRGYPPYHPYPYPYAPQGMPGYPPAYPVYPGYPPAPAGAYPYPQQPQQPQPYAPSMPYAPPVSAQQTIPYPPPPSFYMPQAEPTPQHNTPPIEPGAAPQAE